MGFEDGTTFVEVVTNTNEDGPFFPHYCDLSIYDEDDDEECAKLYKEE